MSIFTSWNRKWLFIPNSLSTVPLTGHLLSEWIDSHWRPADLPQILDYLAFAPIHILSFAPEVKCAVCGVDVADASVWRWDGEWLWPHMVHHFVAHHSVRLPDNMLETIRKRCYAPPVDQYNPALAESVYQDFLDHIQS